MPYSAPLDGIRAIAILAVLVFHISPETLPGGFVGVDVFFVLSGFLITSIILHDIREGDFSLREFYLRRVQRLLPNIVVTVLVVLVLWKLFLPFAVAQASRHGFWTLFNLSNFYIWRNLGGYWGDAAALAPLLHTWSLAIEEQFYLFFPGSLVLLARFQCGRVKHWMAGATLVSFGLCVWGTQVAPVATFYMLPTRVWELLLGAVLASHRTPLLESLGQPWRPGRRALEAAGWAGLGLVLVGILTIDEAGGFPGLVALVPTVGTALVLVSVADGQTRVAKLLSNRFMVETGKLSYSLYLWHWPLITLGKLQADLLGYPPLAGAAVGGLAGVALAWAAYAFVEQPLRQRGAGRRWRLAAIAAGFAVVAVGSGSSSLWVTLIDTARSFDRPSFHGLRYSAGRVADPNPAPRAARYRDVLFPPIPERPAEPWRAGGVVHEHGGGPPKVVVLGSSHALMYSRVIDDVCRELGVSVAFLGVDQTPVFFTAKVNEAFPTKQDAQAFDDLRRRSLAAWRPAAVFVVDRWDNFAGPAGAFDAELRRFLAEVQPLATRVLFVAQVPAARVGEAFNLREYAAWKMRDGAPPPRFPPDRGESDRKRATSIAEAASRDFPGLRVLRADHPFYLEDGSIRWVSGRTVLYADDDHLTDEGSELLRPVFREAIAEACRAASASCRADQIPAR